jgi:hypothetical protein
MSYIVILMSFQTIYSINYDKMKVRWVFQLGFNLNRIHDSVGKALRTANQARVTTLIPRGKLLWKKRTKIFGIRKSRQFFSGFWDFFPEIQGILGFF